MVFTDPEDRHEQILLAELESRHSFECDCSECRPWY